MLCHGKLSVKLKTKKKISNVSLWIFNLVISCLILNFESTILHDRFKFIKLSIVFQKLDND